MRCRFVDWQHKAGSSREPVNPQLKSALYVCRGCGLLISYRNFLLAAFQGRFFKFSHISNFAV